MLKLRGIFSVKVRAGDVGGNTLGFFGAQFDPCLEYIIAHGFHGALYLWKRNKKENEVKTSIKQ